MQRFGEEEHHESLNLVLSVIVNLVQQQDLKEQGIEQICFKGRRKRHEESLSGWGEMMGLLVQEDRSKEMVKFFKY